MDTKSAIDTLAALAQDTRLRAFRLVIEQGEEGLSAGVIAERLKVTPNTLSAHLGILANSGLMRVRRESRKMIYSVDLEKTRELLAFLVQDCCKAQAEVCEPLIAAILPAYCAGEKPVAERNGQ